MIIKIKMILIIFVLILIICIGYIYFNQPNTIMVEGRNPTPSGCGPKYNTTSCYQTTGLYQKVVYCKDGSLKWNCEYSPLNPVNVPDCLNYTCPNLPDPSKKSFTLYTNFIQDINSSIATRFFVCNDSSNILYISNTDTPVQFTYNTVDISNGNFTLAEFASPNNTVNQSGNGQFSFGLFPNLFTYQCGLIFLNSNKNTLNFGSDLYLNSKPYNANSPDEERCESNIIWYFQ